MATKESKICMGCGRAFVYTDKDLQFVNVDSEECINGEGLCEDHWVVECKNCGELHVVD